jgi:hypothetical protein
MIRRLQYKKTSAPIHLWLTWALYKTACFGLAKLQIAISCRIRQLHVTVCRFRHLKIDYACKFQYYFIFSFLIFILGLGVHSLHHLIYNFPDIGLQQDPTVSYKSCPVASSWNAAWRRFQVAALPLFWHWQVSKGGVHMVNRWQDLKCVLESQESGLKRSWQTTRTGERCNDYAKEGHRNAYVFACLQAASSMGWINFHLLWRFHFCKNQCIITVTLFYRWRINDVESMLGTRVKWLTFLQIPKAIFYIVNDASSQIIFKDRIESLPKARTL